MPVPSVAATSSLLHSFISYLLPLLEVFLNLALLATCLCLFLPQHLSTCLSASPYTSRSHPTPPSSVTRRWMVLCHSPGSSEGRCSVWGKCQSLTGGGGGSEAGWKMSSFTGKSCEPRNVSSSSKPPCTLSSLLPPITFCRCPVGVFVCVCVCVCGGCWGGRKRWRRREAGEVTQQFFFFFPPSPVKKGGLCLWEEADARLRTVSWSGKSPSAEETRGCISRWGGIRNRLIIQTGRARMNFSQRLTPLVTAKHCIKI